MQNLSQLEISNSGNPKIIHNKSVAEFYKSDFKKYDQFHTILNQIVGKVNRELHYSNRYYIVYFQQHFSIQYQKMPEGETFEIKDINSTIAFYNKALVMFHLRQPKAALKIMLAIMKHIDQLGMIQHISVLLSFLQQKKCKISINR